MKRKGSFWEVSGKVEGSSRDEFVSFFFTFFGWDGGFIRVELILRDF